MTEESKTKRAGFDFWRKDLKSAKYVVAPMVDQSELAWRMLSRRYGAELCYTPMFHSSVFVRDPIYRRDAMSSCPEDRPLIVQFCANDPEMLLKAAKIVENDCDAIDLNIGCPQSIAKRGHYGSYLQDEWELLEKMVSLCAKELKVPITCKIRRFDDIDKTVRYAQMLERAGAQLLTVHGRTREQKGIHTGLADWKYITAVKQNVKIPVFANGNIQNLSDVHRCIEETGVQGVMSAEGNLHDPALFTGRRLHVCRIALEYLDLVEKYPCPASFIRGHLFKLLQHTLANFTEHREVLVLCKSLDEFREVVKKVGELCQPDVETYESQGLTPLTTGIPYWLCQPYVRPDPPPIEQASSKRTHPSLQDETDDQNCHPEESSLRNKSKRIKNASNNENNNRAVQEKKNKFEACTCGQPKGLKCTFMMCRSCCKSAAFKNAQDCLGHKFFINKENREMRKKYEASCKESNGGCNVVCGGGGNDLIDDAIDNKDGADGMEA